MLGRTTNPERSIWALQLQYYSTDSPEVHDASTGPQPPTPCQKKKNLSSFLLAVMTGNSGLEVSQCLQQHEGTGTSSSTKLLTHPSRCVPRAADSAGAGPGWRIKICMLYWAQGGLVMARGVLSCSLHDTIHCSLCSPPHWNCPVFGKSLSLLWKPQGTTENDKMVVMFAYRVSNKKKKKVKMTVSDLEGKQTYQFM